MAGDTVKQMGYQIDQSLAGVMPDHWHGHARITITERDLSPRQAEFAEKLSERIIEKYDVSAEKAGEKAIEKAKEKYD